MTKIFPIPFSEKVKNKTDEPVTVMTFNLRFGLAKDGGPHAWEHRKPLVSKILETYPNDFIGFQEVNHFQAEFLIRSLRHHDHIGWYNKGVKWWQNNLILFDSSWECLGHRHFFLSHTPDILSRLPGSRWPRQCVIGWFKKKNRYLLMVNTHFDFTSEVQQKSAGLVMKFLKRFPKGVPQIITGDFNTTPGSPAHRCFKSRGFGLVKEGESITTFHDFTGKKTGRHIDWILYRNGLSPVSEQVIQDSFNGLFPSDHYPVRADFAWML
ncbi:metal-dependent hydrolase [Desulfobacter hydrogenophilus]|uniref:Endonuclease/exonuclease/phosphatase family protein n=1 Tax=Desulfobacter hydrogenophilus TaxID=2291 RepID=A0A328FA31_9BACT|nr:endonuclease/exonuclease/phosphatase family protein [Desulfobacter hydrogenophilus]NDY74081.1 endonuclease/exonuclease/phosphatase family protein [Desulfobacter hydrogenophilus]QBH14891.1 endonuclease/exonuclease/phosphatase family protein [Desulfobacter hydrogenophilus]RAM00272.1 metal-dependent hydrolase [Desulfobacter hydrogenophilus]